MQHQHGSHICAYSITVVTSVEVKQLRWLTGTSTASAEAHLCVLAAAWPAGLCADGQASWQNQPMG
jgi:hypothetical protein